MQETQRISFIHTADIHYGVENYGRIDPHTGIHTRLLDFDKAFGACIDAAIEKEVDLFVFSGDAYKTAYPTPTQQKLLLRQFLRLQQAGIPAVIIVGNHDHPLSFGRAHALDVFGALRHDHFYVFDKPRALTIQTKSGPVQVIGVPWPMRHNVAVKQAQLHKQAHEITTYLSEQVCYMIQHCASSLSPNIPTILAGHLTVASGVFSGSEKKAVYGTDPLFLPSQLALSPVDYVALGHLHRYQNVATQGSVPVVYSGSPERVDFGERKEEKGYVYGTITVTPEGKQTNHSFCKLTVRPMLQIEVVLTSDKDHTEQVLEHIAQHDLSDAIIKIVYHVPAGEKDKVDLHTIQKACRKAHYVVGVIPVHVRSRREQRAGITSKMSMEELIEKYLTLKSVTPHDRQRLIQKAASVVAAYEREQEQGDEAFNEAA